MAKNWSHSNKALVSRPTIAMTFIGKMQITNKINIRIKILKIFKSYKNFKNDNNTQW